MQRNARSWLGSVMVLAGAAACGASGRAPSGLAAPRPLDPAAIVAACASPQHRQLDFWIGDWDVVVKAKGNPGEPWGEARGSQRVEAILGGCAIAESFAADGPGPRWAGRSYSAWQPQRGQWRQTWVDDSGSYLAFTGGVADGVFTLVGEPRERDGQITLMRMVFLDITPTSLRWEWQRQVGGGDWEPQMIIEYRRRGGPQAPPTLSGP